VKIFLKGDRDEVSEFRQNTSLVGRPRDREPR
jgi:hypothetical protein